MTSKKKIAMIVNPHAGKHRGGPIALDVAERFRKENFDVDVQWSEAPGGTRQLAEGLNQSGYNLVLVVGGDGSLFEVINGLSDGAGSVSLPLGQIPVGTGNSFIKDLGIESVDDAVSCVLENRITEVDVPWFSAEAGTFRFVNLLGAGFVSNVARRAGKYKIFGPLSYIFGVFEEVIHLDPVSAVLEIDGETYERDVLFVEICNSRFTGGDMMMAPGALVNDGLLDVVVMNRASRTRVLGLLPKIFSGAHVRAPEIEVIRGRSVRLTSLKPLALTPDGETFGTTPIEVGIVPGALRMFGKIASEQAAAER